MASKGSIVSGSIISRYMDLITSEAVDMELHPNMNRRAVVLCRSWNPLVYYGGKLASRIQVCNIMVLFEAHRDRPPILLNFFFFRTASPLFSCGCLSCFLSSISFFILPLGYFLSHLNFLPLFLWRFRHYRPPFTTRLLILICYYKI